MVQIVSQTRHVTVTSSRADASRRVDNCVHGPIDSAPEDWWCTLLKLPARVLVELPEPIALRLRVEGSPSTVLLTTADRTDSVDNTDRTDRTERTDRTIVFDRDELVALVLGVEADRIWHPEFLGLCFEKWRTSSFQVSNSDALAGANPDSRVTWSMAQVLRRLGAQVVSIELIANIASIADIALAQDVKASAASATSGNGVSKVNALPRLWAAA